MTPDERPLVSRWTCWEHYVSIPSGDPCPECARLLVEALSRPSRDEEAIDRYYFAEQDLDCYHAF